MDPSTRRAVSKLLNVVGTATLSASGSAAILPAVAAAKIAGRVLPPDQTALVMTAVATSGLARGTKAGLALAGAALIGISGVIDPDKKIDVRGKTERR